MSKWINMCFVFLLFFSCHGRIDDTKNNEQYFPSKSFGLQTDKPTLVVFGAVWCKPCRKEISALNKASQDFSNKLNIVEFLVEGQQEGSLITESDFPLFTSAKNEKPLFTLKADANWNLFDSLLPVNGRRLPFLLFVDADGKISHAIQKSVDYESELKPLLNQFLQNGTVLNIVEKPQAPIPFPANPPPQPESKPIVHVVENRTLKVDNFAKEVIGTDSESRYQKFATEWKVFAESQYFYSSEEVFLHGVLEVKYVDKKWTILSGVWTKGPCTMTVIYNEDLSVAKFDSVCEI